MNKSDYAGPDPFCDCYYLNQINSRGLPFGEDPLGYSLPSFLLQFSLISMVTRLLHFLLKPVGQPLIVAQILGGILLGPSLLGRNISFLSKLFPRKSQLVLDTVSIFGFMLFVFLIGVKMDISVVMKSGKKALAVGILGFFVPLGLAGVVAFLLNKFLSLDHDVARALPHLVPMLSMTAFPVITCFLDELKLLNSEIGRLATSSSVICDMCLWSITCIDFFAQLAKTSSLNVSIGFFVSVGLFIVVVILAIRPAALWVIQHTPETRPVKETYIFLALIILLASGFAGEVIGIHATTASLVLGLIVPDGRVRSSISGDARLLCLLDAIAALFRCFWIEGGCVLRTELKKRWSFAIGCFGCVRWENYGGDFVTEEVYTMMIVSVVTITGVISPIVKFLYDPSKRFIAYKRRTILHCRNNDELRILACIHQQEHVHSIISLLHVSNITKDSPIDLVVLHLVKLMGRSSSLLIPHKQRDKPPRNPTQSERIFNAFKKFEEQNPGFFMVHCYKGIAPYMTMHNDVCSLALEKRTILIILPFHKQWNSGETMESSHAYRHLNKSVLDKAPCSVGILIDHRSFKSPYAITEHSAFRVVVLFFGGADDREALAYAQRMSDHNSVRLTLLRFLTSGPAEIVAGTERSKMLDADILSNFKFRTQHTDEIAYKEKVVSSGMDVITVVRSVVNTYNLVMVGRRHGDSSIMHQLAKWNERGDLGAIGEILAASEVKGKASVLVVQQQTRLWGLKDPEESTHLRRIKL
ncbi:hypothetical protein DH2020_044089 [Rehmannia glutinosa]|uniref:Cation/H+ exchanger domain-containing protein n=1 Tax=Rehmannia glutinosa TaxID=99300 RepID=A0ABR0UIR2_REHGL